MTGVPCKNKLKPTLDVAFMFVEMLLEVELY